MRETGYEELEGWERVPFLKCREEANLSCPLLRHHDTGHSPRYGQSVRPEPE